MHAYLNKTHFVFFTRHYINKLIIPICEFLLFLVLFEFQLNQNRVHFT